MSDEHLNHLIFDTILIEHGRCNLKRIQIISVEYNGPNLISD